MLDKYFQTRMLAGAGFAAAGSLVVLAGCSSEAAPAPAVTVTATPPPVTVSATPTPVPTATPTRTVKPKPKAKPKKVKIPNTVGYMLPEAEDRLDRAGVSYSARATDGLFGIVNKDNWMVCKQIKLSSKRVRLDVAKYEC